MKKLQRAVYNLIREDDENGLAAAVFDGVIITLIIINVALVILDTFSGFPQPVLAVFRYVEIGSVIIFTAEYLLRLWTAPLKFPDSRPLRAGFQYARSFMAIVDLLAILPFYLPFIFPIDLRVLRMIRLLRLLRLLKMNRYTTALSTIAGVFRRKAAQLLSSMFIVALLMVVSSVLMYTVENPVQPTVFRNAFSGLWWAVATLTTVGYGDIYPVTAAGRVISAVIALLGIGLVAVPTGIISAGFVENIEENNTADRGDYCPHCGKKL
ncbi:MAG: ion transporter [Oscillospiraceae bacterium]|jgi:voltage-gated potassium channel|nr:ion transporter [Oscillospiraceae bacterium]